MNWEPVEGQADWYTTTLDEIGLDYSAHVRASGTRWLVYVEADPHDHPDDPEGDFASLDEAKKWAERELIKFWRANQRAMRRAAVTNKE